ncbi:MAG: carbohydrate kinase [Ferruginibacter sp.]
MSTNKRHDIVTFGEVLWDILPSSYLPGGAPANVAYHLTKLGMNPAVVSRVGDDELGKQLCNEFTNRGVCTKYFQLDTEYATGKVFAEVQASGDISYEIVEPVSWDNIIHDDDLELLVKNSDYFVFGSLAVRRQESRETLFKLLEIAPFCICDINLRTPHYDQQIIETLLYKTDLLKLNLDEINILAGMFALPLNNRDTLVALAKQFDIKEILLTQGENGSVYFDGNAVYDQPAYKIELVDPIGAGDAFLAGFIWSKCFNLMPSESLKYAAALGGLVAGRAGACPDYTTRDIEKLIRCSQSQN